jgi:hypothetical protein
MPTAAPDPVVAAPAGLPESYFVHGISGKVIPTYVVAFRIGADGPEPIEWPILAGPHWQRADQLGSGQWAAHGRVGKNPIDLGNAIKVGRP